VILLGACAPLTSMSHANVLFQSRSWLSLNPIIEYQISDNSEHELNKIELKKGDRIEAYEASYYNELIFMNSRKPMN
jgi:hypothetical protein